LAVLGNLLALERQQLPAGVRPLSYNLSLVPDETNLRFRGDVTIILDVKAATPSIVLIEAGKNHKLTVTSVDAGW